MTLYEYFLFYIYMISGSTKFLKLIKTHCIKRLGHCVNILLKTRVELQFGVIEFLHWLVMNREGLKWMNLIKFE